MRWKLGAVLLFIAVTPAFAKSLYWSGLGVRARLDADGRLHVQERQAMVFDGDWNGGERRFNIRKGQQLDFNGMSRIENGREIPLKHGDLSQVDQWGYAGPDVVRWRSRMPNDPPFENQELVYVLDYVLSGILTESDGRMLLQHDFAFPDRSGVIADYALHFELDPVWKGIKSPLEIHRRDLQPGQSMVIVAGLTYAGAEHPSAVHVLPSRLQVLLLPALILMAGVLLTLYFYSSELQKGRFAPLFPTSRIDDPWLKRYVFSLSPEALGTAWDEVTGAPEVAAVIARMAQEKKLTTWVTDEPVLFSTKPVLHLRLNVAPSTLPEGERKLVDGLFFGLTETDTKTIGEHYARSGFQPASLIKDFVEEQLKKIPEWTQTERSLVPSEVVLFLIAVFCTPAALANNAGDVEVLLFILGALTIIGAGLALKMRKSAERVIAGVSPIVAWLILAVSALTCYLAAGHEAPPLFVVPVAVGGTALAAFVLLLTRSRDSLARLAFRRRLAAARHYFQAQLRAAKPNLRDEWYPYLVALGLGGAVAQWLHAFGGAGSGSLSRPSSSSSSGSSSSGWTGGGGAFGGAGATGSWVAMSALAGGVASPGSGGSGGGGGGGGSGGGGGGGW